MDKGFIFALIFALLIGVFALSNSETVIIDFVFTNVAMSQALVIMLSALLGAIIVFIIGIVRSVKASRKIKDLEKEIRVLEKENNLMKDLVEKQEDQEAEETPLELDVE